MISTFNKKTFGSTFLGVMGLIFIAIMMYLILGWPNFLLVKQFLSVNPSPLNAVAIVSLSIWVAFALIGLYALLSGIGVVHKRWTSHYREEQMEFLLAMMGVIIFAVGILHGPVVHASTTSGVLQFVIRR